MFFFNRTRFKYLLNFARKLKILENFLSDRKFVGCV